MNAELKKILVIDDNSDIRDLIQFIFEKSGRTVFQGENGEKGLAQFRALRPDVVLLDATMPGISGLDVLKEIRNDEDRDLSRIPVMMLTANSSEDDIAQAFALGASSYVVKPFKKEKIVAEVDLMLQLEEV
jgi:DNA-binding response OmpR family regulator